MRSPNPLRGKFQEPGAKTNRKTKRAPTRVWSFLVFGALPFVWNLDLGSWHLLRQQCRLDPVEAVLDVVGLAVVDFERERLSAGEGNLHDVGQLPRDEILRFVDHLVIELHADGHVRVRLVAVDGVLSAEGLVAIALRELPGEAGIGMDADAARVGAVGEA